jgi:diguanylate cyclase (GGDEF)-like protein
MYGTSTGSYSSGALLDLGWFGGFLAIGVAGLALGASPLSHSRHGVPGWRRMAIAHVPAGIAMAIVFYDLFTGRRLHVVEILSALVIVVALAAREFLLVAENRELSAAVTAGEAEVRGGGFHDPLTGLPTWPLFEDRVRQSLRRARRDGLARSVLVVGVDDFDLVQRRMGEATAEAVTLGVADRLQSLLRNADSVAHIGQGEFAVLLDVGHQVPERVAQRVVDGLRTTLDVGGQPLAVSASVGLASERRPDASPEDLVAQAESAMAQSRAAGRTALGDPGAIEAAIGVQRF